MSKESPMKVMELQIIPSGERVAWQLIDPEGAIVAVSPTDYPGFKEASGSAILLLRAMDPTVGLLCVDKTRRG